MPIEPIRTKEACDAQCGVLVRDKIPISIQQWYKPQDDPEVSYVNDMQKEDLWTQLKANFTLPPEEDPEKPAIIEPLVKAHALKKMADLFRRWKNELKTMFVDKEKIP